jgi:hypothetical protein
MSRPSTPLLGLLAATIVVAILFLTVFKSGSSSTSSSGSIGQYQGAINAARQSAAAQNAGAAAQGAHVVTTPAAKATPAAAHTTPAPVTHTNSTPVARTTSTPAATTHVKATVARRTYHAAPTLAPVREIGFGKHGLVIGKQVRSGPKLVDQALIHDRPVVILFANPRGVVDRLNVLELLIAKAPRSVLKVGAPVATVADYAPLTNQVQIDESPTIVIINRYHEATTITGFTTVFEIEHRIADALAAKPST